jgi:hypothetical protein
VITGFERLRNLLLLEFKVLAFARYFEQSCPPHNC